MTATFLLIRHAAHGDLDQRLSGRRPGVPLTEAGHAQAARLAARLTDAGLTRVQCSPLERTCETAGAIAAAAGLAAPERVEALTEIELGAWTGRDFASLKGDPDWTRWNAERATARPPGGESMAEAQARIVAHLWGAAAAHADERIALVTHSDMIRGTVCWLLGLSLDKVHGFDIDPASVSRVVIGDWGGRVLSLNEGMQ